MALKIQELKDTALAHLFGGQLDLALESYRQIIESETLGLSPEDLAEMIREKAWSLCEKGEYTQALQEIEKARGLLSSQGPSVALGKIYSLGASIKIELGRYEEAKEDCEKAFEILKGTGENREVAIVLRYWGDVLVSLGNLQEAQVLLEDSLSTFRRVGDEEEIARANNMLAQVYFLTRRWEEAIEHLKKALEYSRKLENKHNVGAYLGNLGTVYLRMGNWKKAKECLQESLEILEKLGDKLTLCRPYLSLGLLSILERDWEKSWQWLQKAKAIAEEGGYTREVGISYEYLGELAFAQGDYALAQECFDKVLKIASEIAPEGDFINQVHRDLAELYLALGEIEKALNACDRALEVSIKFDDKLFEGIIYHLYGLVYERKGDKERARESFVQGAEILQKIGEKFELGKTLLDEGKFLTQNYQLEEAKIRAWECLQKAYKLFQELDTKFWMATAELEISRLKMRRGEYDASLESLELAEALFSQSGEEKYLEKIVACQEELEERLVQSSLSAISEYSPLVGGTELPFSPNGLRELLGMLIDKIAGERGLIAVKQEENGRFKTVSSHNFRKQETCQLVRKLERILNDNGIPLHKPIISLRVHSNKRFFILNQEGDKIESFMLITLGLNETVEGFLYVDRLSSFELKGQKVKSFGQKELNYFILFSNIVALKLAALKQEELRRDNLLLRQQLEEKSCFANIITRNNRMLEILKTVEKIKDSSIPVLLEGETGTGKELIARAIHYNGVRRHHRFVAQNCAALPESLLESLLFGHKKGAFTGATCDKKGFFEVADGGTFFLDEVGEVGPSIQVKLLRVLEEGEIIPLGDTEPKKVDVRIISATNKDLWKEVLAGRFREDLYYRLNAIRIEVPPLRNRKEDIPLLAEHFLELYSAKGKEHKKCKGISQEAMQILMDYDWPGNVRQLSNEMRRAVTLGEEGEPISPALFSERISASVSSLASSDEAKNGEFLGGLKTGLLIDRLESLEKELILSSLEENNWVITKAAKQLGIHESTLRSKMKRYGLGRPRE